MKVEAFEPLLDRIYTAGEDPRHWDDVLSAITRHLSAKSAALHAGTIDGAGFSFGTAYRVEPEALASYAEYYYSINPLNSALARIPVGVAVSDQQLVKPGELKRTEFYNDYGQRFDIEGSITLVLARNSLHEACLGIVRGLGSDVFTGEQVSFVQRLAPHMLRAIGLNRRLASLNAEFKTFEAALERMETGVLLLNGEGLIHYCNASGIELLNKCDGLTFSRGRLSAANSAAQTLLAGLIQTALAAKGARGGSVSLPRQNTPRPLLMKIMPFAQESDVWLAGSAVRAIVFISDPDAPVGDAVSEVMDAYNLTPAEKRLLQELIVGRTLQEAADSLKVKRVTARNRLARIMAKTDTRRQSELLQLLHRSRIPGR